MAATSSVAVPSVVVERGSGVDGRRDCRAATCTYGDGRKGMLAMGECGSSRHVAQVCPSATWRSDRSRRMTCSSASLTAGYGRLASTSMRARWSHLNKSWASSRFPCCRTKLDGRMEMGEKAACGHRRSRGVVFLRASMTNAVQEGEGGAVSERPFIPAGDHMVRCISTDAELSVFGLVATDLVDEAQRRHVLSPTAAAALGRALMGTILLGAFKGEGETVQLSIKGGGPLGFMTTVGDTKGQVKGLVTEPSANPPLKENGKLDVGAAVGRGTLSVVRNHPTWKFPYRGSVAIQTGEIAEDITFYLAESEQTNSAIGLGVIVDKSGSVTSAAGFMVQVLPFASDETLTKVEENIRGMSSVADMVGSGKNAADIIDALLQGIGVGEWSEQVTPIYGPCGLDDLKSRMKFAVKTLGQEDIQKVVNDEGFLQVTCEFCNELVRFEEEDLKAVLEEMKEEAKETSEHAG